MIRGKLFPIFVIILTSGCQLSPNPPKTQAAPHPPSLTPETLLISVTKTPLPTNNTAGDLSVETAEVAPSLTPSPTPIGPLLVVNGGFDSGIQGWERPYGELKYISSDFHTGPGAARLRTSDYFGLLEYRGNTGQCIDLNGYLNDWPVFDGQRHITLEAYLGTDADIFSVSLNGIFINDNHCGTGQVGFFEIPPIGNNQEWVRVSATITIPETTGSLHVFVSASGATDSAAVLIDDVRVFAINPTHSSD